MDDFIINDVLLGLKFVLNFLPFFQGKVTILSWLYDLNFLATHHDINEDGFHGRYLHFDVAVDHINLRNNHIEFFTNSWFLQVYFIFSKLELFSKKFSCYSQFYLLLYLGYFFLMLVEKEIKFIIFIFIIYLLLYYSHHALNSQTLRRNVFDIINDFLFLQHKITDKLIF